MIPSAKTVKRQTLQCGPPALSPETHIRFEYLKRGIQTPMAQGRSTKIISMMKWIRSSRLSIKKYISRMHLPATPQASPASSACTCTMPPPPAHPPTLPPPLRPRDSPRYRRDSPRDSPRDRLPSYRPPSFPPPSLNAHRPRFLFPLCFPPDLPRDCLHDHRRLPGAGMGR